MRAVWLTALAACSYSAPASTVDAASPDGEGPCESFSSFVDTCTLPPGTPLQLSGMLTFDTNTGDLFDGAQPVTVDTATLTIADGELKAILASAVVFAPNTTLRAVGSRPFAILAGDSIELGMGGKIDVSVGGAGARETCPNAAGRGTDRNGGASGGGGGGLGGAGGTGSPGDSDSSTPAPGGVGGTAVALPASLLGGCAGAAGGDDNNDDGGRGGLGGGAVYLAASRRIELGEASVIEAVGEGGRGGEQSGLNNGDGGGGGGGSGGMIVLESPAVIAGGTLTANGGGGGEGSGGTAPGNPGERGRASTERALGGRGRSASGSDGGDGGAKFGADGNSIGTAQQGGGGGGGGGVGFIRILSAQPQLTSTISPAPS